MMQDKKKMIEAKTQMWAQHTSGAENWQLLHGVPKPYGANSKGTEGGNLVRTTPVLPPLNGTGLSPAILQQ